MSGIIGCPRCGTQFTHARIAEGEETICPGCGLTMQLHQQGGALVAVPEPPRAGKAEFYGEAAPRGPRPRFYRFDLPAQQVDSSCCLLGCAVIVIVLALAARGCASLF